MDAEIWKPIRGFEGFYEVSNLGRIISYWKAKPRILKPWSSGYRGEYLSVSLCDGKTQTKRTVHSLVMATFVGPCPNGKEINHVDGNKHHNSIDNLEYVTPVENMEHAHKILGRGFGAPSGFGRTGEKHPMAKLTQDKAEKIRALYKTGKYSMAKLAGDFGVSSSTVWRISNNLSWGRNE